MGKLVNGNLAGHSWGTKLNFPGTSRAHFGHNYLGHSRGKKIGHTWGTVEAKMTLSTVLGSLIHLGHHWGTAGGKSRLGTVEATIGL